MSLIKGYVGVFPSESAWESKSSFGGKRKGGALVARRRVCRGVRNLLEFTTSPFLPRRGEADFSDALSNDREYAVRIGFAE